MDKFDYFIAAVRSGCATRAHWIKSVFSPVEHEVYDPGKHKLPEQTGLSLLKNKAKTYPFRIFRVAEDSDMRIFINYNENGEAVFFQLGELPKFHSVLNFKEKITIDETMIPTVSGTVETCYGNFLVNWLLFYLPFGTKIPFQTGKLDGGKCDKLVNAKFSREIQEDRSKRNPDLIYVDEYLKYQKHASYLDNWSDYTTASMTMMSLTPRPEVQKFFKEKLKELGHPPTVTELATIEEEAAKLDRELFKGSEDENFLVGKNYDVNRKKMYYIYGLEEGFGLSTIVIPPLSQGIKADDLPDYANALRAASFNRGAQTALGGVGVKRANQIFQAIRIAGEDCKDTEGFLYTAYDIKDLLGTHIFMKDGLRVPTEEEAKALLGKPVRIRSPMSCKETTPHYCAKCVGADIAMLPNGVHNTVAAIQSREMLIFMKAMHGRSLKTAEYDIARSIS